MFHLAGKTFHSRLLLGTAQYPSPAVLKQAIEKSHTEIITVSLRRQNFTNTSNTFWEMLQQLPCSVLPNTAGCYSAKEAITTAHLARELFNTSWIKLEIIGDDYTLHPNNMELIKAAEVLQQEGFTVFPYCTEDLVTCQALVDCGCEILMPWAAPIGSGRGLQNHYALQMLVERFADITLIIDAGIGKPSHAVQAMELGFDAVLLNTAVARAQHPIHMAHAFALAVNSGRLGYEAGLITPSEHARASTPLIDKPFWETLDAND
jgi:thiazole synthase